MTETVDSTTRLRTLAVVGTGMMGTSLGLAVRGTVRTYLIDIDHDAAMAAESLGAGVAGTPPEPVDLAVLAVPPRTIAPVLAEQQARGLAYHYTDVGSVKGWPLAEAEAIGCDLGNYVGGHPIAGSERSGPMAASEHLFRDRIWVLTPQSITSSTTMESVTELVRLCGARPMVMAPSDHDRAIARSSHVPHLLASILAASIHGAGEDVIRLCGSGIRDTTRIAAGDSMLWTDILQANSEEVAKALTEVAADLFTASRALSSGSVELTELLRRGNAGRATLMAS
ncbi:prephenate dehydrogenase [Nocardia sp. NPDC101769]|uniref:prephenate dehydrogenase n=1 Tax=Nocardia sp. NPDC101769 TaxID=3364333 RepID=UPI0038045F52